MLKICHIVVCLIFILKINSLFSTYSIPNPLLYNNLEPQYPSYVSINHLGLCLKARFPLAAKTIVGTALMIHTDTYYAHDNKYNKYKHVGIMGFKNNRPIYGRVIGKYALCNHSCRPNCIVTEEFLIKTIRHVQAHEELTVAYNAHIMHMPWNPAWTFYCACKSVNCKKIINSYRTDIIHPASMRDAHQN